MKGRRRVVACAALLLSLSAGCDRAPTAAALQAKFDEAERLCLDQKYGEAKQLLKEYLLLNPHHPGAHFYLARTYIASLDVRETSLAVNEYQLALRLFQEQGRISGITRYDPTYFELMCQLDSANALWVQAQVLAQDRTLIPTALGSLRLAHEYIERARTVNPKATEVDIVAARIGELAGELVSSGH